MAILFSVIPISTQALSGISWVLLSFALTPKIGQVSRYRGLARSVQRIRNQHADGEMVVHRLHQDMEDRV